MRWLLKVRAEYRKSTTGSGVTRRRHATSVGAGLRRGAWLPSPGFTSSRNTVRRSSSIARPAAPNTEVVTVANTRVPVPPRFSVMSASRVSWASIGPQRVRRDAGQEVEREPRRRQRVALAVFSLPAAERQPQGVGGAGVEQIGRVLRPADVRAEVVEIEGDRGVGAQPLCSCRHWSASPPWLHAAPAAMAIATKVVSAISASEAPAIAAFFVWASMHQGHWVIWAMPRAISSLVLAGMAPSLKAFWSNSRNAR